MVTSECTEVAQAPSGVLATSTVVTRENGDGSVPGGRHKTRPRPYSRAVPLRVSGQREKRPRKRRLGWEDVSQP
jgi:hypothetical protein